MTVPTLKDEGVIIYQTSKQKANLIGQLEIVQRYDEQDEWTRQI